MYIIIYYIYQKFKFKLTNHFHWGLGLKIYKDNITIVKNKPQAQLNQNIYI